MEESQFKAAIAGETHYYTGRPCIRGHVTKRYTSTGACAECLLMHKQAERAKLRALTEKFARLKAQGVTVDQFMETVKEG